MSRRIDRIAGCVFVSLLTVAPFAAPAQAGSVTGPLYDHDVAQGGQTVWYTLTIRGGERTNINLNGDNVSDLDMFVVDMDGRLIQEDLRFTNAASIWLEPQQTLTIRVAVRNAGSLPSEYELRID